MSFLHKAGKSSIFTDFHLVVIFVSHT